MNWKEDAIRALRESLYPVPTEHNGLDWKRDISANSDKLAQHLSAFANNDGGGFLVFGVSDDAQFHDVSKEKAEEIVRKLSNIATHRLEPTIQIEHDIIDFEGHPLLFIRVPEHKRKPVHMRGANLFDTYWRTGGSTLPMPEDTVRRLIAQSDGYSFEQEYAKKSATAQEVLALLDYEKFFSLRQKNIPQQTDSIIKFLENYNICRPSGTDGLWHITNLGALLFARDLKLFPALRHRGIFVRRYASTNNRTLLLEHIETRGYAVGFEFLVDFVMKNTSSERIDTLRETSPTYPRVAIREFIANALVHQDFMINGISLSIEIFTDRLVITNPGVPLNDINRLIHLPPNSRNNDLAQSMYELGMCERRGSGLDRAVAAIEDMCLPAVKIEKNEQATIVRLFPKKTIDEMTKQERIDACYQHACLMFEDNSPINNKTVRDRFNLDKSRSYLASRILTDTVHSGLIKPAEQDTSRKFASYYPYYV